MLFNINDSVRVKLTPSGRTLLRRMHDEFWQERTPGKPHKYVPPKEDAEGWSRWQLWYLMETFGPHVGLGLESPFDTVIQIDQPTPPT